MYPVEFDVSTLEMQVRLSIMIYLIQTIVLLSAMNQKYNSNELEARERTNQTAFR
jgi:hypothetical protein